MYFILCFVIILQLSSAYYLTTNQKQQIRRVLSSDQITDNDKDKLKKILINKYSYWAINQARNFHKKHKLKRNYVLQSELIQSSLHGLVKSMKLYNGTAKVSKYSSFYIENELYKCLTNRFHFGMYNHYHLMHKKMKISKQDRVEFIDQKQLNYGIEEQWKDYLNRHFIMDTLNKGKPTDKYIFLLRYDIYTMNVRNSLKYIALHTEYSLQYIGQSINRTKKLLKEQKPFY